MRFYAPLLKVEEEDDGTLKVSGVASTETPDRAGEVVKADAIKAALPDFFAHGTGALREMHQLSAAGTVDEAEIDDTNKTMITATVVDPVAIEKVRKGVYKGFSIGGKVLERDTANRKVITKIALNEISLVDRPANPEAVFEMWKADMTTKTASDLKIETREDLKKAIQGFQSFDDKDLAKSTIMAAAETLEAVEFLPEAWTKTSEPASEAKAADATTEAAAASIEDPVAKAEAALANLEVAVTKVSAGDDLKKGLYEVGRFADVLQTVAYLVSSGAYEAQSEGDNSPVPAKLRAWLTTGAAIFKEMATEEIDELISSTQVKKAEEAEALAKADAAKTEELTKITSERDDLSKALSTSNEMLGKVTSRMDELAERLSKVEAQPAPAKTAGPLAKAVAVSKEEDTSGQGATPERSELTADEIRKGLEAMSEDERAFLLTKAALSRPLPIGR